MYDLCMHSGHDAIQVSFKEKIADETCEAHSKIGNSNTLVPLFQTKL